ncbi:MAG: hypothetical protein ACKOS8_07905 [Gemmataceae bacterium]
MHQQEIFGAVKSWQDSPWLHRPTQRVRRTNPLLVSWLDSPEGPLLALDTQPERWHGILHLAGKNPDPENQAVELYAGTLEMLSQALKGWEGPIQAIFMGAQSDPFAGPEEAQELAMACIEAIASHGIKVWVRTRARILSRFRPRLAALACLVRITVPLSTASTHKARGMEPGAPSPKARLRQVVRLREMGLAVLPTVEPLVPGVTDTAGEMEALFTLLKDFGIQQTTMGYLPLPEGSLDRLAAVLAGPELVHLAEAYSFGPRVRLPGNRIQRLLPKTRRLKLYTHLSAMGARYGIRMHVCRWSNPDLEEPRVAEQSMPRESLAEKWKRLQSPG